MEVNFKEGDLVARRWKIRRQLGKGGMGAVFLAEDKVLDREVAIKFLLLDGVSDEDLTEALARFGTEIKLLSSKRFRHPSIIEGYDMGATDDGLPFYLMEYYDSKPLYEYAKLKGPLGLELRSIMVDVAKALAHVHPLGVVHRDLKPDNIFVGVEGAKIADFGTAKLVTNNLTVAGSFFGSFNYCSPEQVLTYEHGEDLVDSRADLYSYGATFYQVLTGKIPHHKSHSMRTQSIFRRVLEESLPGIHELNPSVPQSIAQLVGECLIKDKDARLQNADTLLHRLGQIPDGDWNAVSYEHLSDGAGGSRRLSPDEVMRRMAEGAGLRGGETGQEAAQSAAPDGATRKVAPKTQSAPGGAAAAPAASGTPSAPVGEASPSAPPSRAPGKAPPDVAAAKAASGTQVPVDGFTLDSAVRRRPAPRPAGPAPGSPQATQAKRRVPLGVKLGLLAALLLVLGAGVFVILQQEQDESKLLAAEQVKAEEDFAPQKVRSTQVHAALSGPKTEVNAPAMSDETAVLAQPSAPSPEPVPVAAAAAPAQPPRPGSGGGYMQPSGQPSAAAASPAPQRRTPGPVGPSGSPAPATSKPSSASGPGLDEAAYYMPNAGKAGSSGVVGFGGKKKQEASAEPAALGIKITTVLLAELMDEFDSLSQGIPVQAKLTGEFMVGGQVILPRGTRFLGAPGGVTPNNRVQVNFHTILTPDGQEIPFSGVAQSADGGVGIAGFLDYEYAKRAVGHAVSGAIQGAGAKVAGAYGSVDGPGSSAADRATSGLESDAEEANEKRKNEPLVNIHLNKGTSVRIFVNRSL